MAFSRAATDRSLPPPRPALAPGARKPHVPSLARPSDPPVNSVVARATASVAEACELQVINVRDALARACHAELANMKKAISAACAAEVDQLKNALSRTSDEELQRVAATLSKACTSEVRVVRESCQAEIGRVKEALKTAQFMEESLNQDANINFTSESLKFVNLFVQ